MRLVPKMVPIKPLSGLGLRLNDLVDLGLRFLH